MIDLNLFRTFVGLGVCAALLSGCVSLTPDQVYPIGRVAPLDAAMVAAPGVPAEATVRTASSGDILFEQPVGTSAILTLVNDIEADGDVSLAVQARTVSFTRDMTFYPVISVGSRTELAACSFDRPATWTPRLNQSASGQGKICFILEDLGARSGNRGGAISPGDLELGDTELTATHFFFVSEGVGLSSNSSPYQQLARWDPQLTYAVVEPARFSVDRATIGAANAPSLALRYVGTPSGGLIEPVYIIDGRASQMRAAGYVVGNGQVFPATVTVNGAQLELLAVVDGVLAYRILSGFPANQAAVLDLPQ